MNGRRRRGGGGGGERKWGREKEDQGIAKEDCEYGVKESHGHGCLGKKEKETRGGLRGGFFFFFKREGDK